MRHNLSDVGALMRDRRSFAPEQMTSRKVHPDIVEEVLRAGTWAGNHGMTQPWRFTVFMGEGLEILREGLPQWHALSAGAALNPIKMEKLKHRLDACNCVIGLGRVHDPSGRISEEDEAWAVAGAVQNMHLTCTAYGLGAKWTTPWFHGIAGGQAGPAFARTREGDGVVLRWVSQGRLAVKPPLAFGVCHPMAAHFR
jgi:nitroreductase